MKRLILILVAIVAVCSSLAVPTPSQAVSARNWKAGNIIDDSLFTNKNGMSVSQIQNFLDTRLKNCDYWGTQTSEIGGGIDYNKDGRVTRAEYGKTKGNPAPFTCLNKYYEVPKTTPSSSIPASNYGKSTIPTGAKSAARLIYDAAQAYGINPKVLLVKLATESAGPLTSDPWPFKSQYTYAMGARCPDSGPGGSANCDVNYSGFSMQMREAAALLRWYLDSMSESWWSYKKPYETNYVLWNVVETSCGGSNVYLQNRATAALYTYTPYQPNAAALNNMYGTGDGCSAYGNRNFWRVFTDWFGSTTGDVPLVYGIKITSPIAITPGTGDFSTVSFKVKNTVNTRISFDKTIVQCRNYQNENCDSSIGGAWYVDPGQERTFSYTVNVSEANKYTIVPYLQIGDVWYKYEAAAGIANAASLQNPDIEIVSPIAISGGYLNPRSDSSVSFKIKNAGNSPISISKTVMQCRYEGQNCDSNYGGPTSVGIGETKTFTYFFTSKNGGYHTFIPYIMVDGTWRMLNPSAGYAVSKTINVADLMLVNDGLTLSNPTPITGEPVTAAYTIINNGTATVTPSRMIVQCRIDNRINCDPEYVHNDAINAGEEKTYTTTIRISEAGTYTFKPYFEHISTWSLYLKDSNAVGAKSITASKYFADMRLTNEISISPANPKPGDDVMVTYNVKNFGTKNAYYQRSVLQCRLDIKNNCDNYNPHGIIIGPGEERAFTTTYASIKPGKYRFVPYFEQNNGWRTYNRGTASANEKTIHINPLTITTPISLSPVSPAKNSLVTVTYSVKNFSSQTFTIPKLVLQCRLGSLNCDSLYKYNVSITPGEERLFTHSIQTKGAGQYRLIPYYHKDGKWNTYGYTGEGMTSTAFTVN